MILLGASNVTLGFGVLTRLIRNSLSGPVEIYGALGHGRSYGVWSTVLVRSLPPIVSCGLWDRIAAAGSVPTFALLTDVGNDLMYGFMPEQIAGWVSTCLDRLSAADARIVVTRLPIARVERLGPARYHATRMSFFPRHKPVAWSEMLDRARHLDELTHAAAARCGAAVVTPQLDWYGFDPIHIRWTRRRGAWSHVLSQWPSFHPPTGRLAAAGLNLLHPFAEQMRFFGRERRTAQPVTARNDMTLSLY